MVAGDYLIIITNSFLKYQTNKSKVVTKKDSKCKYSQLLATSDEDSDMDDDAQPITKENRNETDNEEYTSFSSTKVRKAKWLIRRRARATICSCSILAMKNLTMMSLERISMRRLVSTTHLRMMQVFHPLNLNRTRLSEN